MSKIVDFESVASGGYRGRLINWEKWCDGKAHLLEYGHDFTGDRADSTRSAGIQWAKRHGLQPRTTIVTVDDDHLSLAADLERIAGELAYVDDDEAIEKLAPIVERIRELNPKFVFEIVDGLTSEQKALAKRLQRADGEFSDEVREELRASRRGPEPEPEPVPDPVAERRERLSDELAQAEGDEGKVLRSRRVSRANRPARSSDEAVSG